MVLGALVLACLVSLGTGAADLGLADLFSGSDDSSRILLVSRVPRTLAAVLAGSGVAVAGSVMQMSMHNRFVSPTTAGTSQFALVGLLAVALLAPATSVMGKMLVASACAVAGSGLLLRLLHRHRTPPEPRLAHTFRR